MAHAPLITFKAGRCTAAGRKITPIPTPGYLYLYTGTEDELIHFCWRSRNAPSTEPEDDLLMIPSDATFTPLVKTPGAEEVRSPTNGRVFVLKFASSGEKRYFWMQSRSQHKDGDADFFSLRDQRLGQIVDSLLAGEEVDVQAEIAEARELDGEGGVGGDAMDLDGAGAGGAGAGATGGDVRQEGELDREGGNDGGRAPSSTTGGLSDSATTALQNLLDSFQNNPLQTPTQQQRQPQVEEPYTTLPDLLPSTTTIPYLNTLSTEELDNLCTYLPPDLFLLAQESTSTTSEPPAETTPAAQQAALEALSPFQKRQILERVLRSPQLHQSLGSLTVALRDGGLPMIGEALGLGRHVRHGGFVKEGGSMPMGGSEAVKGFVEGVRGFVEEEEGKKGKGNEDGSGGTEENTE